jgi:cell wall-associated NlpC family hydrolase
MPQRYVIYLHNAVNLRESFTQTSPRRYAATMMRAEKLLAGTSGRVNGRVNARLGVPVSVVWPEPSAVRDRDSAIVGEHPDAMAWTRSLDHSARLGLHGRVSTQALLGEPVIVVAERDGWSEVRLPWQPSSLAPEGYPGWVPSSHLVDSDSGDSDSGAHVPTGTIARTLVAPARHGGLDLGLSLGTVLPLLSIDSTVAVFRHPDGGTIEVPSAAVALTPDPMDRTKGTEILATARLFSGLPYQWGGLSGYGVDCSGLVHLAHRVHGLVVPRDAHDQATTATSIGEEGARPGDPVFFASDGHVHHVALATHPGFMLHSPRTGSRVREDARDGSDYAGDTRSAGSF